MVLSPRTRAAFQGTRDRVAHQENNLLLLLPMKRRPGAEPSLLLVFKMREMMLLYPLVQIVSKGAFGGAWLQYKLRNMR